VLFCDSERGRQERDGNGDRAPPARRRPRRCRRGQPEPGHGQVAAYLATLDHPETAGTHRVYAGTLRGLYCIWSTARAPAFFQVDWLVT
jgi:hypothetical protein